VISSIDSPLSEVERSIAPDCRPAAQGTSSEKSEVLPYVLERYLMSKAERSFFGVLEQVTDSSKYYIFPQVSLNNLVTVEKGTGFYQTYHNKVDRKSVDFVLFDRNATPSSTESWQRQDCLFYMSGRRPPMTRNSLPHRSAKPSEGRPEDRSESRAISPS